MQNTCWGELPALTAVIILFRCLLDGPNVKIVHLSADGLVGILRSDFFQLMIWRNLRRRARNEILATDLIHRVRIIEAYGDLLYEHA